MRQVMTAQHSKRTTGVQPMATRGLMKTRLPILPAVLVAAATLAPLHPLPGRLPKPLPMVPVDSAMI